MKTNIFIHIPKCGGSTVRDAMLKRYRGTRMLRVYGDNAKKGFFSVETLKTEFSGGLTQDVTAISGHLTYGDLVEITRHNSEKDFHIFSVVRNPIQRAVSNFNYMRLKDHHRGHKWACSITNNSLFETLVNGAKSSGWGRIQADFLGYEKQFEALQEIVDNIDVYRIENLNLALVKNGIIETETEPADVKNVSTRLAKEKGAKEALLSVKTLKKEHMEDLEDLYGIDFQLHQLAI